MLSSDSNAAAAAPSDWGAAVVVPVYGAAAELDRCLASIGATTDLVRHPLVLVLDGPQPREVEAAVAARAGRFPSPRLLRLPQRRGFPAAANRGLAELPERDAVLVNSDVETTSGWLEKMSAAASSRPGVASVTPLTNNGTLASAPRWFEENTLPAGWTLDSFANLVERLSQRRYPEIPTGVGFCLLMRRQALNAISGFDEGLFRMGYGEEVDWCLRASAAGFLHLLDDSTFVFHHGARSFGRASRRRVARGNRTLTRRHPDFQRKISALTRSDLLVPVLRPIWEALQPPRRMRNPVQPLRVVHVVHGWPPWNHAGTETYAARLVRAQTDRHDVVVYSRYASADRPRGSALELVDRGARVRLVANDFLQRDPFSRNALHDRRWRRGLAALLDEFRPDLVHVHHLAGHCLTLTREATRRAIPILWQLQDWWASCARANRLDARGGLCPGPRPGRCARCLPPSRLPPMALWGSLFYAARLRLARRALAGAAAFLAGSRIVVDDHLQLDLLPVGIPVHLLEYGVPALSRAEPIPRAPGQPLRLGFIGSLLPHKGLHQLVAAIAALPHGRFCLDVWGEPRGGPYAQEARQRARSVEVRFHPPFLDSELGSVLAGLDLLIAPSLGLESYGLAVAEAHAAGVPTLVSNRGALPERVARGGGAVFEAERPETLTALLRGVLEDPELLERWRRTIPAPRNLASHAEEVESIYRSLLPVRVAAR